MSIPTFSMRQLLDAGVHFGHTTRRWNPKMAPFIFGERNGIHILDLQQTVPMLNNAIKAIHTVAANGGRILFVGTKPQASKIVQEAAVKSGQYYINHRWLGGMMTNWKTVNQSIARLKEMEERLENPGTLTKKEILKLQRNFDKLNLAIGGIRDMGGVPDILLVIDTNKEAISIKEANKLNIPVVGVIDSNSSPEGIDYPVPGNDDAIRSIALYCDLAAQAILSGMQQGLSAQGFDIGAQANVSVEEMGEIREEEVSANSDTSAAQEA